MRFSGFLAIVLAVLVLFISPSASRADNFNSYSFDHFQVPSSEIGPIIGIDGNGLIYSYPPESYWEYGWDWNNWGPCGNKNLVSDCYYVQNIYTGDFVGHTSELPIPLDDGKNCTLSIPGEVYAICSNNGKYVLFSEDDSIGNSIGVFIGYYGTGVFSNTDSFTDIDPGGDSPAGGDINGLGDALIYENNGDIVAVANLSNDPFNTPEPGSFILLSSGALALFGALRRRMLRL